MRAVKGAALGLLSASLESRDEAVVIAFRGPAAEILLEPCSDAAIVERKLEMAPTGGRTPLAHALQLARQYVHSQSCLILLTDGKANVALNGVDPWDDALAEAAEIRCPALLIDTTSEGAPRLHELARALRAELHRLDHLGESGLLTLLRC